MAVAAFAVPVAEPAPSEALADLRCKKVRAVLEGIAKRDAVPLCHTLNTTLRDVVQYPISARPTCWSLQQSSLPPPLCIAQPTTTDEVSTLVKITTNHTCPFALLGGGHSPEANTSSAPNSILLSTSHLTHISTDDDFRTLTIGAAYRWNDLYALLEDVGVSVVGTRNGQSGVVGSILGGGLSYHTMRYGMACDNVEAFEVVVPNGTVVWVEQGEVFRALKGGGTGLGVVTSVKVRTVRAGPVWDVRRVWVNGERDGAFEEQARMTADPPDELAMANLVLLFRSGSTDFEISQRMVYYSQSVGDDSSECAPRTPEIAQDESIRPANVSATCTNISTLARKMDNGHPNDHYNLFGTLTILNSASMMHRITELFCDLIIAMDDTIDIEKLFAAIVFNPISKSAMDAMRSNGYNALGIVEEGEETAPLTIVNFTFRWKDPSSTYEVEELMRRLLAESTELAKEEGLWHPYVFKNHAFREQGVSAGRGRENMLRLKALSEELDESGKWMALQNGWVKPDFAKKLSIEGDKVVHTEL
ncbi:hypothetical protein PRZ48_010152 [Zasmidium cellare]|uniref:FAD-binding PCMH-type domain-containing protein n=1 Tax=Zasmidium cellare TaxID=395010 RepID=A0ABR0EE34_ZASCE|nr:hypothetical protein PRZ48_010152 [Zasmidium cellare]